MPLTISTIAFVIFTVLLWLNHLGEAAYCFLVAATALLGLVLHGFGRLQELDLKNLRIVLREIEQTKRELFVREEKLKQILVPLAQIIALTGASEGRFGSRESREIKQDWYKQRIQCLVSELGLSPAEATEVHKYTNKYAEFDSVLGKRSALRTTDPDYEETKNKLENLSNELMKMMKSDISRDV